MQNLQTVKISKFNPNYDKLRDSEIRQKVLKTIVKRRQERLWYSLTVTP